MHTRRHLAKNALRTAYFGALALFMTGCILRITGGFAFTDEISTFVRLAIDDVSFQGDARLFPTNKQLADLFPISSQQFYFHGKCRGSPFIII